jgi:transposase
MDITGLLLAGLGLQDVLIENASYDLKTLSATIQIRQRRELAKCSRCGEALHGVKQWRRRTLKGIALGALTNVKIIYYQLQGGCGRCVKHRLSKAPFIHPRFKKLTTAFAENAGRLMEEITCEATARLVSYDSKPLWQLDQWRMRKMKTLWKPSDQKLNLKLMSADEVHMRTVKPKEKKDRWKKDEWERKFITNLVCYNHSKVIANAAGRDTRSLRKCLLQLSEPQRLMIEYLAVDMHDPFIKAATKLCPNAEIAVDRFHLAEAMNRRFDEVRKTELTKAREAKDPFQEGMLAPSRRFVLMERDRELTRSDQKMLDRMREENKNIHNAMLIVEYFHVLLDKKTLGEFRKSLALWKGLVEESNLVPMLKFSKLVTKYVAYIETYIKSHLTTAVSEGLNNKIKVLKRMGYGYTNEESFMNKILQRCGFLNSNHIQTNSWYFEVHGT